MGILKKNNEVERGEKKACYRLTLMGPRRMQSLCCISTAAPEGKKCDKSGIRTHASGRLRYYVKVSRSEPEHSALDHSAILPADGQMW